VKWHDENASIGRGGAGGVLLVSVPDREEIHRTVPLRSSVISGFYMGLVLNEKYRALWSELYVGGQFECTLLIAVSPAGVST
jgi:hypothetical protein